MTQQTTSEAPERDEVAEAEARRRELEMRYVDGEDIDPAAIEEAERHTKMARLKARRDRKKAAKEAERQRRQQVRELIDETETRLADAGDVPQLYRQAVRAVEAFVDAAEARNEIIDETTRRALSLHPSLTPAECRRLGYVELEGAEFSRGSVTVGDRTYDGFDTGGLLARVAWLAADKHDRGGMYGRGLEVGSGTRLHLVLHDHIAREDL